MTKVLTNATKFKPAPGYVLIDPLEKDQKTEYVSVQDSVDRSYKGHVLAIGEPKLDENGNLVAFFGKVGDFVQFSIAGVEETKMELKGDMRHRVCIAPFNRVLGKWEETK